MNDEQLKKVIAVYSTVHHSQFTAPPLVPQSFNISITFSSEPSTFAGSNPSM